MRRVGRARRVPSGSGSGSGSSSGGSARRLAPSAGSSTPGTPASYAANRQRGRLVERLHPEARQVTDKRPEQNLRLPDVARLLWRSPIALTQGSSEITVRKQWAPWLGRPLSSEGAYGRPFKVLFAGEGLRRLEHARRSATFLVEGRRVPPGATVLVKVTTESHWNPARPFDLTQVNEWVEEQVHEAVTHRFVDRAPCLAVPGVGGSTCPSTFVPDLYWAGLVRDTGTGGRMFLTVMALAPGVTLSRHLARNALTASAYLAVERAITLLWLHGVTHSDFHGGNQLYDAAAGRLTIIDFGQAVLLSPELTQRVRQTVGPAIAAGVRSLGELWLPPSQSKFGLDIQAFSNRVRSTRDGVPWFNPDGFALRRLFSRLRPADRARVADMRRALWGQRASPAGRVAAAAAVALPSSSRDKRRAALLRAAAVPLPSSRDKRRAALLRAAAAVALPASRDGPAPMEVDGSPRRTRGGTSRATCTRMGFRYDVRRRVCRA